MNTWRTAYFCVKCKKELSYIETMCSHGTCPNCGQISGSTVVECTEKAWKYKEPLPPFWKFWEKKERVWH